MADRPPNILLVVTDDQRFDTIRALGCSAIETPTLDRIVERGTAFTAAHIAGGTVPAVCMPSRAMLHTGRTLFALEEAGLRIPAGHTLLGEHFAAQGYQTWATGKWHNGPAALNRSFQDGAEIFFGGMNDHWNVPASRYDSSGRYDSRLPIVPGFMASNAVLWRHADHVSPGRHSSELFCDAMVEFLKGYDRRKPFFASLAFMAPHDPRTMPRRYLDLYDPERLELPPNFLPGHPFDNGELAVRDELLAAFPRSEAEIRTHIRDYYAMISHLDAELGRVMAELEWQGLAADTIVVLAGDNGLALGQHGLMGKQSVYEHSVRVPLLMSGPGIPRGERRDSLCYLLDIFPTVCELAGLPIPQSVQGCSLVPALRDPAAVVRDSLYLAYSSVQRAVKDGRCKLIEYVVGGERMTQLFDLARDPWERENLAGRPGQAGTTQRLRKELLRHRDEWEDRATPWGAMFWDGFDNPGGGAARLTVRSRLREMLDDPAGREALERQFGDLEGSATMQAARDLPLMFMADLHPEVFTPERVAAVVAELARPRAAAAERESE